MGTDVKKLRREVSDLRDGNLQQTTQIKMSYRWGVLPSPEELSVYEKLSPGVTNRILESYEKQVNHWLGVISLFWQVLEE